MSPFVFAIVFILLGTLASFFFNLRLISPASSKNHKNGRKLPPGPSGLPIIGNLHILGNLPHHTLYNLAKIHGPIMHMRLGSVHTIVVSSARAAALFLKTHDAVFGTRPNLQSSHYLSYGTKGIAFTGYGPYWRSTKKLVTMNLLCASKIESFAPIRKEELGFYVETLKRAATAREVVNFSVGVGKMIENIACREVFGVVNDSEFRLKELVKEALYLGGAFNIADFIPFLAPFDLQGLTKRMKACNRALDKTLERMIDEHEKDTNREKNQQCDFIDVLLSLMNQPTNAGALCTIDRTNVKAILLDMIVGSFDTSAATIEWTFAELLRHPRVMKCLQDELQNVVGMNNIVEEKHLPMLPYLDMVIKETLRLHPIGPLLVPRESMEDVTVDDYYIPKKSLVMVNVWSIGRDPDAWLDEEKFLPERFMDKNIDFRGQNHQLIPFGSGRRQCPGIQLGLTIVKYVAAQLVHLFDWELANGLLPIELDMSERFGLSVLRANHLLVNPKYRLAI